MNKVSGLVTCAFTISGLSNAATVGLDAYSLAAGPISITGISENLSGISYNPVSITLFAIVNGPEEIHELNLDGSVIRKITLPSGIDDTEGLVHLGGTRFAFLEERKRNMLVMDLQDLSPTNTISLTDLTTISIDVPGEPDNLGLEGITYDSGTGTIYVVKEKSTPTVYSFSLNAALSIGEVSGPTLSTFLTSPSGMSDLTGLHFDQLTNNLLILSHESQKLIEVATSGPQTGQEISSLTLTGIPQAEGVTMGPNGEIYIVSESDQFYRFNSALSPIPEPGSSALLFASAIWLTGRRKRGNTKLSPSFRDLKK